MLALPTRTSDEVKDFKGAVLKLISTAYGEDASRTCLKDANALQALRVQMLELKPTADAEAAEAQAALLTYVLALTQLQPLIGAEVREQQALAFTWRSAFDSDKAKLSDLRWEQCGALLNLAAVLSSRAALQQMGSVDEIKLAAKHCMMAAGVLQLALDTHPHAAFASATADVSDASLGALRQLMVAQAQACFCEKAARDNLRPATQAQLCMGARQSYEQVGFHCLISDTDDSLLTIAYLHHPLIAHLHHPLIAHFHHPLIAHFVTP